MTSRSPLRHVSRILLASTALSFYAGPILAQQAAPPATGAHRPAKPAVEEIFVTARKRRESLNRVPVAVTALSAKDLQKYPTADLTKIGQLIPQVIIAKTGGGGAGASLSIRGIGSSALDAGIDQSVAVNIDGTQITRGRIITQSFFDIRQVEVLKGPQALFFGKNSPAGVISLASQGPTNTWQGYVKYGHEFDANENYVEAAAGGPINDEWGIRVALRGDEMDGYIKNVAGALTVPGDTAQRPGAAYGEDPGVKETLGRITIDYHPTTDFNATLRVFGSAYKDHGEISGTEVKCAAGTTHPNTLDLASGTYITDPYGDCKLNGVHSYPALPYSRSSEYAGSGDGKPYTNYGSIMTSLTLNYTLNLMKLTAITSYYNYRNADFDNFDYSAAGLVWGYNEDHSHALSQELRAVTTLPGPLNFAFGGYYEDGFRKTVGDGMLVPLGTDPRNGKYNNWLEESYNTSQTYSAFAQATYNILPNLELAAGARYTYDHKTVRITDDYVEQQFAAFGIVLPEGDVITGPTKSANVSPEVTLSYHPTHNSTVYAAFKTGYKSGGFSNPSDLASDATLGNLHFGPEKAIGGEVGAKGNVLDNRLTLSGDIYYYEFNGLQLTSFDATTVAFFIKNAAQARTKGAELEAGYALTDNVQLHLAGGYNKASYLSFPGAACYQFETAAEGCVNGSQDLSGRPLVRAPKFSMTAGVSYEIPVAQDMAIGLNGDMRYTTGYYMEENANPLGYQNGFLLLNAGIRLHEINNNTWEIAMLGQNLTNKYYGVAANDKPLAGSNQIEVTIGRPRELDLQATYRF